MSPLTRIGLTPIRTQFTRSALLSQRFFQTSSTQRFDIPFLKQIPQPPGYVVGNVNDAYIPPHASKTHGSLHWTTERLIAIGLVPLTVVPFVTGSFAPVLDAVLSVTILAHSWIGFQACIIDYVQKRVYGSAHDYAIYLLSFGTVIAGLGIYNLEANDVGLTGLIAKVASAKKEESK
ncbi:hypothetical protein WICPIJ_004050 [Wickerhamomyces pijperi]|uniref:Succinate dehydrogenase [ubiquinone] cytochrome b small subunit n=1 Tax=Wickerhamomyces pijperi TaxID=599730 RepID=A0A9P8Q6L8_WICPI|nr:hypothetical protein WICPIJ_004050 [Wickerhamomyces pijperi]